MSSTEKLYFRRNFTQLRTAEKSIYLKLFNVIERQKKYDEVAIIKKFSPLISHRNLASQKHYLYKQLCEALLYCDSLNDNTHAIYRDIQLIRMFRKKGMLDEANALWKKTVLKARRAEAFALLNLLKAEFGKMILFSGNQTGDDELHAIFRGNIISYSEYTEMMNLRDIYTEVLLLKRKAHFDIDEKLKARIEILLEMVQKTEDSYPAHSFWFRHYQRMNKATLLYLTHDIAGSLSLLHEVWEDWKLHPHYLETESEFYIEVLYMINYAGILKGEFDFVENVFNDPIHVKIGHAQRANFEAVKYLALNKIYNKTARYNEVEKLIDYVKAKYREWEPVLNADMNRTLTMSAGIASLVLEQYSDALYFIKRGLSEYREGGRKEQEAVGHLLLLLITYSINNARLFDAQYRSTYNYFYKKQKKRAFETSLVQCFHRTFYMTDKKEKQEAFKHTLNVIEKTKNDKVQQMAFSIFNFPGWLNVMIQRIPYRQYVQKTVRDHAHS